MSAYQKQHIKLLIEDLAAKAGEDVTFTGLTFTAGKVHNEIAETYLYEKYEESKKEDDSEIAIQRRKLDLMLDYLGFKTIAQFLEAKANPIHEVLFSLGDTWLSYVRQNSKRGTIYRSPVKIREEHGKMLFYLSGPHQDYIGEVTYSKGTIYILFKTDNGKQFHHVYKVGGRQGPKVLQGVFSGVSTVGEPIGGRAVLIRDGRPMEELKNIQLKVSELKESTDKEQELLGKYFEQFADNNLSIRKVDTFEIEDLE